jgi:glycosyltransferase involved in cell wall biosynthesis
MIMAGRAGGVNGGRTVNCVVVLLVGLYGLFALVALLNLGLMRRPRGRAETPSLCVLIPARDEAANLARLVPALVGPNPGLRVYVFDDESSDGTAEVAARHGAVVVRPKGPLPAGWTGKNRACHELAKAAAEDSNAEWMLFLDADVYPEPEFIPAVRWLLGTTSRKNGAVSGFPQVVPGRGIEPLFLAWVGWSLLATNPFGVVARTGMGHNRFTNGQFHAWRREVYTRYWPNEQVRAHVMEDVTMGRLMAREGVPIEVVNVSSVLGVRMYETWRQTLDGMSKNAYEITGSAGGTVALALLMLFLGWAWLLAGAWWPVALGVFLLSGLAVVATVRTKLWPAFALPVAMTICAYTLLRSLAWRRAGKVVWKGRTYPG